MNADSEWARPLSATGLLCAIFALGTAVSAAQLDEARSPNPAPARPSSQRETEAELQSATPELVIETGHTDEVNSVAFSPAGDILASGSSDNTVKVWDVNSGLELRTLVGHTHFVDSIAFSPSGRQLASASWDHSVKVWDVVTGRNLATLLGHTDSVLTVAFCRDGHWLATGGMDNVIKIWDVATGRQVRTLSGHSYWVTAVSFSPDGRSLLSASWDGTIKLWDLTTWRNSRTFPGQNSVNTVAFSPDGRRFASGSQDHTARVWDTASGHKLHLLLGHSSSIQSVAFSPDSRWLATASADETIRFWDVATGKTVRILSGHTALVAAAVFSPDGRWLASGGSDRRLKLWETDTGREMREFGSHARGVNSVSLSPDGSRILAGGLDHTVMIWGTTVPPGLRIMAAHSGSVEAVVASPDGCFLASGSKDKTVKLWEMATGKEVRTLVGHRGWVQALAFSPDGRWLASGSRDKTVKLWELTTGHEIRSFTGHSGAVVAVTFSPDGNQLASGSWDGTVRLWDTATGQELRTLSGHTDSVTAVSFSREGKLLASGSWDRTVKLWDVGTGRELRTLAGHRDFVESVALDLSGRYLASGSRDHTVKLWDVASGLELRTLVGHTTEVKSLVFGPEGRWLVSGSRDGSVRFWDFAKGTQVAELVAVGPNDWAIVDSEGRFDASPGGMELMHWVVGLDPISLAQLKERYYEPGLLAKILGFDKEPLRFATKFGVVSLFPTVRAQAPLSDSTKLKLELVNRNGGIGRVQVFVNGKEFVADARSASQDASAAEATIDVDLAAAAIRPGEPNDIRVVSWNADGYVSSRGFNMTWQPQGLPDRTPPEFYAIVSGISRYSSQEIQLRFASKDAQDIATALELGARRFFGPRRVHVTLLTSPTPSGGIPASKENLKKAFEAATNARPGDVLVVYLAGHGVAVRNTYAYPTQEARTLDLSDPVVLSQSAVSSEELVEWIKKVPALHQVMILDTCAAAAAATRLVEKRDVPGDQIRAIERLKDRTGFFVLMGSAADSASYEASQFSQGLLTYALLRGMKGPALREGQFVDVAKLFHQAEDDVPQLAKGIGGIQQPRITVPNGTSFDIGKLLLEDRDAIPLASPRPLLLRPVFLNRQLHSDNLHLSNIVRRHLRDSSDSFQRGSSPVVVYVDEDDLPGAISPSGDYVIDGNFVKVTVVLTRTGQELAHAEVEGSIDDIDAIGERITAEVDRLVLRESPKN
jgi:WD40 repeat protein